MKLLVLSLLSVCLAIFVTLKSYEYIAGDFDPEPTVPTSPEQEAILAGADPTELLEATAAGSEDLSVYRDCRFGKVTGNGNAEKFNDAYYVSYNLGNTTYIQISPLIPTYLKQRYEQTVSAETFNPDEEIRITLSEHFSQRDQCSTANLYLEKIKNEG